VGEAKLSIDDTKSWLPIGSRSFPLMQGTEVRSSSGGAVLELADGSRVNLLPFSAVRFTELGQVTEISVLYGRLTFRLSPQSRVQFVTPSARLEPASKGAMQGELFVNAAGQIGLKMKEGDLRVVRLDSRQVLLASREPVFLPKRPAVRGALFTSDISPVPPLDAKAVFAPNGYSVGYVAPGQNLVIAPGFTADLTRPFPAKLVRLAMAKIPKPDVANDAMPLFDVNGQYVGYVSGPVFYAQDFGNKGQEGQAPAGGTQTAAATTTGLTTGQITALSVVGGALLVGGVAAGVAGAGGGRGRRGLDVACLTPASPRNPNCP
jgi:hypothetical protein